MDRTTEKKANYQNFFIALFPCLSVLSVVQRSFSSWLASASSTSPTSPRAAVFRAMETIVRGNFIFNRMVKPDRFRTWRANPGTSSRLRIRGPLLRWTPMNTGEEFKTPDTMAGDLLINCEVISRAAAAMT